MILTEQVINEVLERLDEKVDTKIDLTDDKHLAKLEYIMLFEMNFPLSDTHEMLDRLNEKRNPGDIWKTSQGWAGLKPGEEKAQYGMPDRESAERYVGSGGKEKDKKDVNIFGKQEDPKDLKKKTKKENPKNKPISQEEINDVDGTSKERVLDGKDAPPGTESSAVNEIGTGYAMACMDESPKDVDGCLDEKLKGTRLGRKPGNNSEEKRGHMIRAARREKQRVNATLEREGMNPKNTKVSHIGGSKGSLDDAVKRLDELQKAGLKEVNGIKIDKYKKIIMAGGGGDDPTDTLVVMVEYDENGKPIKAQINHTSNKMTSSDQQSNSGPVKTAKNNNERAKKSLPKEAHKEADKIEKDTQDEIKKQRKLQAEYVGEYAKRIDKFADDPEVLDMIYKRLMNDKTGNPPGISTAAAKYMEVALTRIGLSKSEREELLNPPNEKELKKHLKTYLKSLKDKEPGGEERKTSLGANDIGIMTRLLTQEKIITGKTPIDPPMLDSDLKSYYGKQTDALNSQRERLNKLGEENGQENLGNKTFVRDLIDRMHLNIAEGHDPNGIPNQNFELIHGSLGYKNEIRQDDNGDMYEKGKGGFYKLDGNGKPTGEPVKAADLNDFDCPVVGNPDTHRHCLGLKDGEKVEEGFDVRYKEYKMEDGSTSIKALIYDRNNKPIAVQTCRPKSGPGGMIQDSMVWSKDYEICLAKQSKLQGYCE